MSEYAKNNLGNILAGEGTWFTAYLLRLIAKADGENLNRLRLSFPDEVKAVEKFRGSV